MARHSNNKQQVAKISSSSSLPSDINNDKQKDCSSLVVATEPVEEELDRKVTLATEGFTTNKFCELILRNRTIIY